MTTEKKKISLQEAIKQQLANKKQANENGNSNSKQGGTGTQKMKSQHTKKPNNQRRKTGA
ncbi:hypothetical protein [Bacillus suaedaesalsae]|uniref:DUF4023 domain-containing protein n=1 Tax=Bacillus suaedaesalsae TaxID=2810349 RepID=A0ABS2DMW3_9BACI|nr:hypothetical protein [Bacillus suaedaesalsae]MBM6619803.1 hypothetical protein [Bacillus suaedaesalsae]